MDHIFESGVFRVLWLLMTVVGLSLIRPPAPAGRTSPARLLPDAGWALTVTEEIRRSEYRFSSGPDGSLTAPNRIQGIWSRFEDGGLRLSPRLVRAHRPAGPGPLHEANAAEASAAEANGQEGRAWEIGLRLERFGRDGALERVAATVPRTEGDRVEFRRGPLTEWYLNEPAGIEQGLTVDRPLPPTPAPAGAVLPARPLVVEMAVTGTAQARAGCDGSSVLFMTPEG